MPTLMQLTEWLDERNALELHSGDARTELPPEIGFPCVKNLPVPLGEEEVFLIDWERFMKDDIDGDGAWWEIRECLDQELRQELEEISCGELIQAIDNSNLNSVDGRNSHWDAALFDRFLP